ncbi:MAG: hypothetical protein C0598_11105 [Marinilabiliales bacterium]|nr:MAG: hypothetical protein C0598_11105 [Marinilabiliales bacterium]
MNIGFPFKLSIIVFIFLISIFKINAQENLLESTINKARELRDKGDFEKAAETLIEFNNKYPDNVWVMRLYAETLYWMEEYEQAGVVYNRAYMLYPNDYDVIYEYSLMLYSWGKYNDCIKMLEKYTAKYDNVTEAYTMLGISQYYIGNYSSAQRNLRAAIKLNPDDNHTNAIYTEVLRIIKPWLKIGTTYSTDSQPFNTLFPVLAAGKYFTPLLNISIAAGYQQFSSDTLNENFRYLKLKNNFTLKKIGLNANMYAGYYSTSSSQKSNLIWGIALKQRLAKTLYLDLSTKKDPYVYTPFSALESFTTQLSSISIERYKSAKWNLKAAYINEIFPDDNYTQTAYLWFLSSAMKLSIFEFYAGYAFSYSDSKESRFMPLYSSNDEENSNNSIPGTYNPYFTPNQQYTNSVLVNLLIKPSNNVHIKVHSSIGFYSTALNPYLYYDYNNNGNLIVKRDFYKETFTPMDIGLDFETSISRNLILKFSYSYIQTLYFNTNNFNINLKVYI